jgi:hypothetical protein
VTATATSNGAEGAVDGATHHHDAFPVASFRDAAKHLRRPFTPEAVKFKVQATWPDKPTHGLIVPYIDARLVVDRLNLVCPHLWHDEYVREDKLLWCVLSVDGIARRDVGSDYAGKGLVSDALKRAGVKFGIGVSLYATPKIVLAKADKHLKDAKSGRGATLALTPAGEQRCRDLYREWLASTGSAAFGEPLDHGDVEGSVGDPDADTPEPAQAQLPVGSAGEGKPVGERKGIELTTAVWALGLKDKLPLALMRVTGDEPGDVSDKEKAAAAIGALTPVKAAQLEHWLDQKAAEMDAAEAAK